MLALAWSGDGKILAVASGNHVLLYESPSLTEIYRLDIGTWSSQLAFQPGSNLLALAAFDGSIQLWETEHGNLICRIPAHNKGANSLAFNPDGRILASAGNDAIVRLWDLTALTEKCELPIIAEMIGGAFAVPDIAFSPDGSLIASIDLRLIRLRDPATQRLTATLHGEASIFDIEFSPDGLLLAAGETNNTTTLWDVQTGQVQRQLIQSGNPKSFIWSLAFSPDGKVLATGSSDGSITLWDMETGEILHVLTERSGLSGNTRPISSLSFNADGDWLASGDLDATVRLWIVGE